ncbi:MAG: glycoside hydrolase family 127 protein [Tepidisphaeraceae bacterium]
MPKDEHVAGLVDTSRSPHALLRSVGFTDVAWTGGFWGDRVRQCADVMIPAMGRYMLETERVRYIGNFLVAAGKEEGRHRGPRWNDGDFIKWLEAACAIYAVTHDAALDKQIDEIIATIASAQRNDGYLHTDIQIRQRNGEVVEPFDNPMDFEMYNMGHLMTAAVVHHRATGKSSLMALSLKAAQFLAKVFQNPTPAMARHGICPSHLMGLVELYRETRNRAHLDLAIKLLAMRDLVTKGDDDNQDRIPFRKQTTAHGHAVRATYLYAGAADIIAETGDAELRSTLETIWQDLVSQKLCITGGCGALFDGASPDGAIDQLGITRIHQAFGRPYQQPQFTAHNETCAAIGNIFFNWRMFLLSGEARFADLVEYTLFNSVLTGIGADGESFFYTNSLRHVEPVPQELRWNRQRQKFISCYCCPPNVVRTIAEVSQYAYAVSDHTIQVVLYGANTLSTTLPDGTSIVLRQQSNYPWDGHVKFTVERISSNAPLTISLRVPAWSESTSVRVNGTAQSNAAPGTYLDVKRTWNAGDVIELDLDMTARLIESHPYVEEARQQVVVQRGPVVYCVESSDLPADVRVLDVAIPADAEPTPGILDAKLGLSLKTPLVARTAEPWSNGQLYRPLKRTRMQRIDASLVPYFAWGNRGDSEMSVWIPLYEGSIKDHAQ